MPRFNWFLIFLHFVFALSVSWLLQGNQQIGEAALRVVDVLSYAIPSIAGYAAMSPNPAWIAICLSFCWLAAPFYLLFFWRLAAFVLPEWVRSQRPFRFWTVVCINTIGSFALLLLPSRSGSNVSDASESVRAVAAIASILKSSAIAMGAWGFLTVFAFSFLAAVTIKSVQLRLAVQFPKGGGDS